MNSANLLFSAKTANNHAALTVDFAHMLAHPVQGLQGAETKHEFYQGLTFIYASTKHVPIRGQTTTVKALIGIDYTGTSFANQRQRKTPCMYSAIWFPDENRGIIGGRAESFEEIAWRYNQSWIRFRSKNWKGPLPQINEKQLISAWKILPQL